MIIFGLSFLAGLLTTLSPCVFPVIPLIVGSSLQRNNWGPLVLASGLVISFTAVGLVLMTTGAVSGLSTSALRPIASILMVIAGVFLLSTKLQDYLGRVFSPIAARADRSMQKSEKNGLLGQFFTGSLLGVLWSPCTGPTMGATLALGAKEGPSVDVVLSMLLFGLGAATPIVAVAYCARRVILSRRTSLLATASVGKIIFGVCIIAVGMATLFGLDKRIESLALDVLPEWLTEISVTL